MIKDKAHFKNRMLDALSAQTPFAGWTVDNIGKTAKGLGYGTSALQIHCPAGLSDLLDSFADRTDRAMLRALDKRPSVQMPVRERIRQAVWARLDSQMAHKDMTKAALSFWAMPSRKFTGARILWRTADIIWNWAGDTATDYNRYSKRALLCGIMATTTLAWLNNDDPDSVKEFLGRRIDAVMQLNKIISPLKKKA